MDVDLTKGLALLEKTKNFDWAQDIHSFESEAEIVAEAGTLKLLKFNPQKMKARKPVLLIPSFINRHYILDLLPEKSLLQFYLNSGFQVYLLNWAEPQEEDQYLTFKKLFEVHLDYLFSKIRHVSKVQDFHIVGQCLGGSIGLIYSLLNPRHVCSLGLLTTPIDFNFGGQLKDWARHETLHLEKFIEARGNAPWLWMQLGFLGLKPTQILTKYIQFFKRRNETHFKRNFLALETWSFDNINVRGQFFLTLIQDFYQKNSWMNEKGFQLGSKNLQLANLKTPLFILNAEDDHIVPVESTLKKEHVPQVKSFKKFQVQGGHIGALIGSYSKKNIWPEMISWTLQIEKKVSPNEA